MQTPLNLLYLLMFMSAGCATANPVNDMPPIDPNSAIYEVPVKEGVSYQDLLDSLKSVSAGMNYVSPASFNIAEQMKKRRCV